MFRFGLTIIFGICFVINGTIDLTDVHLQMIANEISSDDCEHLVKALHTENGLATHRPSEVPKDHLIPCSRLLQHWNQLEGRTKTFLRVYDNLMALGYEDLASRLSRSVYHETAEAARKAFDWQEPDYSPDPNSLLSLDETVPKYHSQEPKKLDSNGKHTHWLPFDHFLILYIVVLTVIIVLVLCCWGTVRYCPSTSKKVKKHLNDLTLT